VGNRDAALEIFAVASLLQARGANPYRVRAYQRAAVRLLRLQGDASDYLNDLGELALPGLLSGRPDAAQPSPQPTAQAPVQPGLFDCLGPPTNDAAPVDAVGAASAVASTHDASPTRAA
jgi:hypothetical protein